MTNIMLLDVNNLNAALEKHSELGGKTLEALLTDLNAVPDDIRCGRSQPRWRGS